MTESDKGIFVAQTQQSVYIRISGRATFQNSGPLQQFVTEMIQRGSREFTLDLDQCQGMDSTFLGVLAGVGFRLSEAGHQGKLSIVNISSRNLDSLKSLCLDRFFGLDATGADSPAVQHPVDAEFQKLPGSDISGPAQALDQDATRKLTLTAHENLVRADSQNAPKFADLTKLLREEIQQRQTEKPPPPPPVT